MANAAPVACFVAEHNWSGKPLSRTADSSVSACNLTAPVAANTRHCIAVVARSAFVASVVRDSTAAAVAANVGRTVCSSLPLVAALADAVVRRPIAPPQFVASSATPAAVATRSASTDRADTSATLPVSTHSLPHCACDNEHYKVAGAFVDRLGADFVAQSCSDRLGRPYSLHPAVAAAVVVGQNRASGTGPSHRIADTCSRNRRPQTVPLAHRDDHTRPTPSQDQSLAPTPNCR